MYSLSYANQFKFYKLVNDNMIFRLAVGGRVLKLTPNTLGDWPYSLVFENKEKLDLCKTYLKQEEQ